MVALVRDDYHEEMVRLLGDPGEPSLKSRVIATYEYISPILERRRLTDLLIRFTNSKNEVINFINILEYLEKQEAEKKATDATALASLGETDRIALENYRSSIMQIEDKYSSKIAEAELEAYKADQEYREKKAKLEAMPPVVKNLEERLSANPSYLLYKVDTKQIIIEWAIKIVFGLILGTSLGLMIGFINPYRILSPMTVVLWFAGVAISLAVGASLLWISGRATLQEQEIARLQEARDENGMVVAPARLFCWLLALVYIVVDVMVNVNGIFELLYSKSGGAVMNLGLILACLVLVLPYVMTEIEMGSAQARCRIAKVEEMTKIITESENRRGREEKQRLPEYEEVARLGAVLESKKSYLAQLERDKQREIDELAKPANKLKEFLEGDSLELRKKREQTTVDVQRTEKEFRQIVFEIAKTIKNSGKSIGFFGQVWRSFTSWLRA
jgi:uncharacterized membrane protein (DUF485 family)